MSNAIRKLSEEEIEAIDESLKKTKEMVRNIFGDKKIGGVKVSRAEEMVTDLQWVVRKLEGRVENLERLVNNLRGLGGEE